MAKIRTDCRQRLRFWCYGKYDCSNSRRICTTKKKAGDLADENKWEDVIAHELFHHWFGDLVTAESWSNLTVNESFADYSEYLWNEYKYGKDEAL